MAEKALVHRMEQAALTTKIRLLDLAHQTLIHIGGDLSVCDMMTAIWQYAIHYDVKNPHWEGRDRFVLSKGHAAAVTSFSQAAIGCYDVGDIYKEYATNFGRFGMHSCNLANPYVDVSTGSLGHGFPVACGMATALKRKGSSSRVYTVVGDGECGEGSIWEAAMYAHQYKLGNLVVFVDRNGMSFDGPTEEYMALEPFADKWRAFGWNTVTIDGHDMNAILDAIDRVSQRMGLLFFLIGVAAIALCSVVFLIRSLLGESHVYATIQVTDFTIAAVLFLLSLIGGCSAFLLSREKK